MGLYMRSSVSINSIGVYRGVLGIGSSSPVTPIPGERHVIGETDPTVWFELMQSLMRLMAEALALLLVTKKLHQYKRGGQD